MCIRDRVSCLLTTTSGAIDVFDVGKLVLSGNSISYANGFTVRGGTLVGTVQYAFGTGTLTLWGGYTPGSALELRAVNGTAFYPKLNLQISNLPITINPAGPGLGDGVTHTISGTVALNGATITLSAGALTNPNTPYGLTFSTASLANDGNPTFNINGNGTGTGTMTLSGGVGIGNAGDTHTLTFNGDAYSAAVISGPLSGGVGILNLAGTTPTISVGSLTGTANAVQVSGTGTYAFNGASTFTGGVILNNNAATIIAMTAAGALGTGKVKFNAAATLRLQNDGDMTFNGGLDTTGSYGGTIVVSRANEAATTTTHTLGGANA